MKFRGFYLSRGDAPTGVTFHHQSRTRQEFLKESLTSTIIDRFAKTGILTPTVNPQRIAQFGDFSQCPSDLLEAHERLQNVRGIFDDLPAETRAVFGNNPLAFVQFMANEKNRSKAIELGLIAKPKPSASAKPVKPAKSVDTPVETPVETPAETPVEM